MESWLWNLGCGILAVESSLWNPGCGILAVESWLRGITAVESWLWNPGWEASGGWGPESCLGSKKVDFLLCFTAFEVATPNSVREWRTWEAKKLIFYCVLQHLRSRPPIPFESGAPGCHRLLLFTAFQRNRERRAEPGLTSPALEKP